MSESLEARVRRLEEIEAIKRLKYKYCYAVDAYNVDEILETFDDNAEADYGPLGQYKGKQEIRRFFAEIIPKTLPFFVHMVHNGSIDVQGDEATGVWYFDVPAIHAGLDKAVWIAGRYDERYRKIDGKWKFTVMKCTFFYVSPYDKGWKEDRGL